MSNPASQMTLEALRSVPLFGSLDDEAAKDLRALLTEQEVASNMRLFRHGDEGDAMYLIERGRVRISIQDEDKNEVTLAELAQGDFFGEMSILEGMPRSASAEAESGDLISGGPFPTTGRIHPAPQVDVHTAAIAPHCAGPMTASKRRVRTGIPGCGNRTGYRRPMPSADYRRPESRRRTSASWPGAADSTS